MTPGALIFIHEENIIAKAIQLYEAIADRTGLRLEDLPNHVCVVGPMGLLVSPDPIGVVRRPMEKYFTPDRKVWGASPKFLSPDERFRIAHAADAQVGKMYDFGGFLRFIVFPIIRWTGCLLPSWFPRPDPDKPFCSELACEVYNDEVDYDFYCSRGPWECGGCTPADLLAECRHYTHNWEVRQIWPKTCRLT